MRGLGSPGRCASHADQHAPRAKRARQEPAAPAPARGRAASAESDTSSSDDSDVMDYLPRPSALGAAAADAGAAADGRARLARGR